MVKTEKNKKSKITFKPGQVTKQLLGALPERSRDIIERRYGLVGSPRSGGVGKDNEPMTLEAIGQIYNITRERVRQIENFAIATIRKSDQYAAAKIAFDELEDLMMNYGGVVREDILLADISNDLTTQNQVNFMLNIGESFVRLREDDDFRHRWTNDMETTEKVHGALTNLDGDLDSKDLIGEAEMLERFAEQLKSDIKDYLEHSKMKNWLGLSKRLASNPLGEWGLADSPGVRTRGVRDYAYLVLRQHGQPLHFSDVAKKIKDIFGRDAHVATTHNELIKDSRFVLVGRGLYALSEWGYANGVVRDIIKNVLKKSGPLNREDLVKEVLKQRQVKENTIYVNLQNSKHFHKDSKGKYALT